MASRPNPPSGPKTRRRPPPPPVFPGNWIWLLLIGMLLAVVVFQGLGSNGTVDYSEFWKLLNNDEQVKHLKVVTVVGSERIYGELDSSEGLSAEFKDKLVKWPWNERMHFWTIKPPLEDQGTLMNRLNKLAVEDGLVVNRQEDYLGWLGPALLMFLPVVLLIAFFVLVILPRLRDPLGGGFLNNYIKSPARRYEKTKLKVTFDDVADMENAKRELQEVVEFLRSPEKFQRLGAQVPKGVLLVGPPGTGKTLLAKAAAGEADVPFYSINGAEFIQLFVGVGASRVRDLFKTAKENAPCLVFIDEIDAVGRMRGAGLGGGSDEREQTLNQILGEMDGFTPNDQVIVLAATNRPDVLDPALLRPGRFDRHVTIERPTWQGRLAILKVHTRTKPLADDVNLEQIARKMIGMTGADLRNLTNEAALLATRDGKSKIDNNDFDRAADRVLIGPKREEVLGPEDKRRTAYHEAGHALVAWLQPEAEKPFKVSIVPRGRTGGVNIFAPDEDRYHHGLDYFKAQLAMMMGGRAVERLMYSQPYAGVETDLKQATRLARYMVTHWGMSDRLGPMAFRVGEEHVFLGKEIQESRDFSDGTARVIDEEVQKFLREADERAFDLLKGHRDELELLVEALLQREELSREEIDQMLRAAGIPTDGRPGNQVFAPGSPKVDVPGANGP